MSANRRIVGVIIRGEAVASIVREGKRTIEVTKGLPETAKFYGAHFDHFRNAFVAVFQDDSFDLVADGEMFPLRDTPHIVTTSLDKI